MWEDDEDGSEEEEVDGENGGGRRAAMKLLTLEEQVGNVVKLPLEPKEEAKNGSSEGVTIMKKMTNVCMAKI